MSKLINNNLMSSGIVRAYVIKYSDNRVFIPGMLNINILNDDGTLDLDNYDKIKDILPKALFASTALLNICDSSQPVPCWVVFENGDINRPIVMGFLGKGIKSVPGYGAVNANGTMYNGDGSPISINGEGDILLVAGHGDGDPGACGNGYKEADLARELVKALADEVKCDVYDTSKCLFNLSENSAIDFLKNYKVVMEVHFNACGGTGSLLLVKDVSKPTSLECAVLKALVDVGFNNQGYVDGNWLRNMRRSYKAGVQDYFLVETCFIDQSSDMELYQQEKTNIVNNLAAALNSIIQKDKETDDENEDKDEDEDEDE
jgi:N-acetylmuramoyl-L-alanine amidase